MRHTYNEIQGIPPVPPMVGGLALSGGKWVPIVGANLAIGNNDLYTVPPGKQAWISQTMGVYNASGGNITYYPEIKVAGVYYKLLAAFTVATTVAAAPNFSVAIVLNAGESFSYNCATTAGLNVRGGAFEWDASDTRLATARNLALASGNNTLLTVPAGKTLTFTNNNTLNLPGGASVMVSNSTGGSLNYYINVVPSGGTVGTTNQMIVATAIADGVPTAIFGLGALSAGDFVNVNSSGADAGSHQIAWCTYFQIP